MPKYVDLTFSDYVPDRGGAPWPENPGYLVDAVNVRFTPNGYRSAYIDAAADVGTTAIGATPLSAVGYAVTTASRHYAGTAAKIYESNDFGVTWYDNAGAAYTATDWDWALFGTAVIAVNGVDAPQTKDVTAAIANNFAALGGTPPVGSRVARVRDSLVLGNFTGTYPSGLQWSSIGDPTDWPTPGSATALARQAGSVVLSPEYGVVTDIIGGEKFGIVFQERAITRMTYVGGDIQFTFDVYAKGTGTGNAHTAIIVDGIVYFVNTTGVHVTDGYSVKSISLGKVDGAIFLRFLSYPLQSAALRGGVAYDPRTKSICWAYSDGFSVDHLLRYSIPLAQFELTTLAGTLLDGTLYSVHDGSSVNTANAIPHCIDSANKLRQFSDLTGVPTTLRTGYVELEPGEVTDIAGIEVLGASIPATPTISVHSVNDSADINLASGGYMPATKSTRTNRFTSRQSGRFHSFQYVDSAQSSASLVRGLRVYYEARSAR